MIKKLTSLIFITVFLIHSPVQAEQNSTTNSPANPPKTVLDEQIPIEKSPSNLPKKVTEAIQDLKSPDSKKRGLSVIYLGEKGSEFPSVIPLLVNILGRDDSVFELKTKDYEKRTTPGKLAIDALSSIGIPAIDPLIKSLNRSDDSLVRQYAAITLRNIGGPTVLEALLSALITETNPYVRIEISLGLNNTKDPRIIKPFLDILNNKKERSILRRNVAEGLMLTKDPSIIKHFIAALKDKDSTIRNIAATTLIETSDTSAVAPLLSAYKKERVAEVRMTMLNSLKHFNDPRLIKLFESILFAKRKDLVSRLNAAEGLMNINDPRTVDPLIKALDDIEEEIRLFAAIGLASLLDPRSIDPLIATFKIEDVTSVRMAIIKGLKNSTDQRVSNLFIQILEDTSEDPEIRQIAAVGLVNIKTSFIIVEPLISVLYEGPSLLRTIAIDALIKIKDSRAVDPFVKILKSEDDPDQIKKISNGIKIMINPLIENLGMKNEVGVRMKAAKALAKIKDNMIVLHLIKAIKVENEVKVRIRLSDALKRINDSRITIPLIDILNNETDDLKVRINAAEGLKNLKDPRAVDSLISTLASKDAVLRRMVAEALFEIDENRAIEPLIRTLKFEKVLKNRLILSNGMKNKNNPVGIPVFIDILKNKKENLKVRKNVGEALKNFNNDLVFEAFISALGYKKSAIRQIAVEALVKFNDPRAIEPLIQQIKKERLTKIRINISAALKSTNDLRIMNTFIDLLTNKKENVKIRKNAAEGLAGLNDPGIVKAFISVLNDKKSIVRKTAIEALFKINDPLSVEPLITALKNEKDLGFRKILSDELKKINDPRTRQPFLDIMNNQKENINVRRNAAEGLKNLRDPRLIDPMIKALVFKDLGLRRIVVETLIDINDVSAISPLIETLKTENDPELSAEISNAIESITDPLFEGLNEYNDFDKKLYSAAELGKIRDPVITVPLLAALKIEKNPAVREKICEALKNIDDPLIIKPFIKILDDSNETLHVRRHASEGLGNSKNPSVAEPLIKALTDDDPIIRENAAKAFVILKESRSVNPLISAMKKEKVNEVRIKISEALKNNFDIRIIPLFKDLLNDKNEKPKIRIIVALAFKKLKNPQALDIMVVAIKDHDSVIRGISADTLAILKDRQAVKPLIAAMKREKDIDVRIKISEAIREINDPQAIGLLIDILKDKNENPQVRKNAALTFKELKDPTVLDSLTAALTDQDKDLRLIAVEAMGGLDDTRIIGLLIKAYKTEKTVRNRIAITKTLNKTDDPDVMRFFIDILKDENEKATIRYIAAEGLKHINDYRVVQPLIDSLANKDKNIRIIASQALWEIEDHRALRPLIKSLQDEDETVRLNAIWGINSIEGWKKLKSVIPKLKIPERLKKMLAILYSSNPTFRGVAALNLVQYGKKHPSIIPFLMGLLGDDKKVKWIEDGREMSTTPAKDTVNSLVTIGEPTVEPLIRFLRNPDLVVRRSASEALLKINDTRIMKPFISALSIEKDKIVRLNITLALKELGDPTNMKLFIELMNDKREDILIRQTAAKGLKVMKSPLLVAPFVIALRDSDPLLRAIAAEVLYKSGDPRADKPLARAIKDENRTVRYYATLSLNDVKNFKKISPRIFELNVPNYIKNGIKRLYSLDPLYRGLAVAYLKENGVAFPSVIRFLIGSLGDDNMFTWRRKTGNEKSAETTSPGSEAASALAAIGKLSIEPLILELKKTNLGLKGVIIRRNTVRALADIDDTLIIEPFLEALKIDSDPIVRASLTYGLAKSKDPRIIEPFKKILKDKTEYWEVRKNVVTGLKDLKDSTLAEFLVVALSDENPVVRKIAAESFIETPSKKAIYPLIKALEDELSIVRYKAAFALRKARGRRRLKGIKPLLAALKDKDVTVRKMAAKAFGVIRSRKTVKPLIRALNDTDAGVRKNAAEALGKLGDKIAGKPLLRVALNDIDPDTRGAAAIAIEQIEDYKMLPLILDALKSDYWSIRENAVVILRELRYKFTKNNVLNVLKSKNSNIRVEALRALKYMKVGTGDVLKAIAESINDDNRDVRIEAINAMGYFKTTSAIAPLSVVLQDQDASVRKEAAVILGKIRSMKTIPLLAIALKEDPDAGVRQKAAEAIAKKNHTTIPIFLIEALTDKSLEVRKSAVLGLGDFSSKIFMKTQGLGDFSSEQSIDALIFVIGESKSGIQKEAAISLGKTKDIRAILPLFKALEDQNQELRKNAATALQEITREEYGEDIGKWKKWWRKKKLKELYDLSKLFIMPLIVSLFVLIV